MSHASCGFERLTNKGEIEMKKKVTREEVLKSIIKLINEHREDVVEEEASLGRLHIGVQTLMWMYDWLCEEYSHVHMERPLEEELRTLVLGDTLGKLADIAMSHIKGDGEYEDESAEPKDEATTKTVALAFLNPKDDCSPAAQYAPQKMTKAQFLEACAEFFDARGTHLNDFELMQVRINC